MTSLDLTCETLTLLNHLQRDQASLRLCAEVPESREADSSFGSNTPELQCRTGRLRQLTTALRRSRSFSIGGSDLTRSPVVRSSSFRSMGRAWDREQVGLETTSKDVNDEAGEQQGGCSGVGVTKENRIGKQHESSRARKQKSKAEQEPSQGAGRRRRCDRGGREHPGELGRFHSDPALRRLSSVSEEAEGLQALASESSGTTGSSTGTTLSECSDEDSPLGSGGSSPRGVTVEVVAPGEIPLRVVAPCRPDGEMRTEGSAEIPTIKTAGDPVDRPLEFRARSRSDTLLPSWPTGSRIPGRDSLHPRNTQTSESLSEHVLVSHAPDHGLPCAARKGSADPMRSLHETKSASLPGRAKPSAEGGRARHAFLSQVPSLEDVRRQFRIKVARAVPGPTPSPSLAPASTIEPRAADQGRKDGAGVTCTTSDADREVKPPGPEVRCARCLKCSHTRCSMWTFASHVVVARRHPFWVVVRNPGPWSYLPQVCLFIHIICLLSKVSNFDYLASDVCEVDSRCWHAGNSFPSPHAFP